MPTSPLLRRLKLITALFFITAFALVAHYKLIVTATSTAVATSVGPRQSSPVALAPNDQTLINVNPEANTITLFNVAGNTPVKIAEVGVGRNPQSVAIHPDGNIAYVANAFDGTVSVVNLAGPSVAGTVTVGAEPMAIALAPNGTRLYVANSASNTLSVINTATNQVIATVNLTAFGTAPRAIGVTNDGDADDTDETIFVALFFGQLRPGKTATQEGEDDQREGRVVAISAATNTVLGVATLGPIANTGFNSNGRLAPGPVQVPAVASTNPQSFTTPTGAFPNQLASVAVHPSQALAYVVSTGASPNGPLRFNQMAQGLVSVFNTATRTEVTSGQTGAGVRQTAPLNINQGVNLATTPAPRLFQTNPVALAWRPNGSDAWAVIQNSDLIVRLTIDGSGIPTVGAPLVAGPSQIVRVDLQDVGGGQIAGKAPQGLAINSTGTRAYVHNFVSRSVTNIDISNPTAPAIVGTALSTPLPAPATLEATALLGAELFYTGRGPQERMSSESWGGCIVCHPHGRSDNITWMFDAGPRQTIPLDGMFNKHNLNDQRILNWSAVRDENHDFELNTRGVFGGRGLIDDDRLFLAIGGASGAGPTDSALIEQFQQFTGQVTQTNDLAGGAMLPTLLTARRDFGVATLGDDRVFIIGGRTGAGQGSLVGASDAVLEFNPRMNTLTPRSSVGFTLRHSLGVAAVKTSAGPRIYAVGGYDSTSSAANPIGTVQEYNPATDTWRTVASLPQATAQFGITAAGGVNTAEPHQLIHVVSGNAGSESAPSLVGTSFSVQRFQADPVGPGVWSNFNVTGLTARRNHGSATAIRGVTSRVFVIGGQDAAGTVLNTVEEYQAQAVTLVASAHTSMPAPRARFGIGSTLTTNQIYVMGGVDGTGADQTSVFEYTVANNGPTPGPPGTPSGSWVTRANLSAARRGLQVTTPPGVTNLLPFRNAGRDARQDAIAVWIAQKVRSARGPVPATDPAAMAGRTLFNTTGLVIPGFSCATCHGGPKFTRSTVDYTAPPSPADNIGLGNENVIGAELRKTSTQPGVFPGVLINVGTFAFNSAGGRVNEIRFNPADISQPNNPLGPNGFNIPSLLSVHETAPYFYSGLAQTLEEVLDGSQDGNGGVRHHFVTSPADRANLVAYLRSIDVPCTIFCPTPITQPNDADQCGAVVNYPAPPTTGNDCGPVSCSPSSNSFFPVGTTTVTCTAVGPVCSFTVTVQDTQTPAITCPPDQTASTAAGQCNVVVNYPNATATDNCPGVTVDCVPPSGSSFSIGVTTVTCTATDASPNSPDSTCQFKVTVTNPPPVLSYTSPQTVNLGQTSTINPATGPSDAVSIVVQNVQPGFSGTVTVDANGIVTVSNATPVGSFEITIRATDACGAITDAKFTLNLVCSTITVDPPTLPDGIVGTTYTGAMVSGVPAGSYTYSVTSGALPNGLALNASTGAITGTPTQSGAFNFRITATSGLNCSGFRDYTVTINCQTITLGALPNGTAGNNYNSTIMVTPPPGPYTFSLTQGNLPSGLTLNASTGAVSGWPTVAGTYNFTVKATGAGNCMGTQAYTLVIACPPITLSDLPTPAPNTPYNQTVTAAPPGGNYSFAVTAGALPAGLSLNPATGVVSGTPTGSGPYSFTITATGFGSCTGNRTYMGTIGSGGCPTITLPASLPGGTVGQVYSQSVAASPSGSYSYALTSGALPPGVTLYNSIGLLYGYPTTAGTFNFTITATDSNNCTGSQAYTVIIGAAAFQAKPGDFDGDGKADTAVFRGPQANWLIVQSGNDTLQTQAWGAPGDQQASGDYDGDGRVDLAVFSPAEGRWRVKRSSDGTLLDKLWGLSTDTPVPGDYDGDGKTDIAVWRGSQGIWYIVNSSNGAVQTTQWGLAAEPYNDVAVPGDYDGDKKTDLAVFRKQDGTWYIRRSSDGTIVDKAWGLATDKPVPGDYDGDGKTDIAVWRGQTSTWFIIRSGSGLLQMATWGASYAPYHDIPVPGDYDGDGKTDIAVWRPTAGVWFSLNSRDGTIRIRQHGQAGDTPVTSRP